MLSGQLLDRRYLIGQRLGQHDDSELYAATHVLVHKPVIVRVLTSAANVKRFQDEARSLSARRTDRIGLCDFGLFAPHALPAMVFEVADDVTIDELLTYLREQPRTPETT